MGEVFRLKWLKSRQVTIHRTDPDKNGYFGKKTPGLGVLFHVF